MAEIILASRCTGTARKFLKQIEIVLYWKVNGKHTFLSNRAKLLSKSKSISICLKSIGCANPAAFALLNWLEYPLALSSIGFPLGAEKIRIKIRASIIVSRKHWVLYICCFSSTSREINTDQMISVEFFSRGNLIYQESKIKNLYRLKYRLHCSEKGGERSASSYLMSSFFAWIPAYLRGFPVNSDELVNLVSCCRYSCPCWEALRGEDQTGWDRYALCRDISEARSLPMSCIA